jgi:deoxyuridine 5'-triphosphate nucleotidohydrolase
MIESMKLNIFKTKQEAPDAVYGSGKAACFDISAFVTFQSCVKAYTKNNGLVEILAAQDAEHRNYIDIPSERVYPRSGLSSKRGLNLINCVGIIDEDYVEEVFVPVYNNSQEKLRIFNGDRIAQAELVFNQRAIINYTNERPSRKSDRDGGFGSTGV